MEATNYTSIGPVLQLNKAGELIQKRIKAVKVCDGLYISEPDKTQFVKVVIEYNGVMWIEHTIPAECIDPELLKKKMPAILKIIEDGKLATMNEYRQEINRRIFNTDRPAEKSPNSCPRERRKSASICAKAYKLARQNVSDGSASGMAYLIEVQKRIDAATIARNAADRGMYWRILQTRSDGVKRLLADLTEFQNISRI